MSKPSLYVRVSTLHGQELLHCPLSEFQRLQEGLLRRYSVLRLDAAGAPENAPLVPGLYPFREAPTVLLVVPEESGATKLSLEIPFLLSGGSTHRLLLDVVVQSVDPTAMMRALRSEIHKRVPLSGQALESYRDWWETTAQDVLLQALEEQGEPE